MSDHKTNGYPLWMVKAIEKAGGSVNRPGFDPYRVPITKHKVTKRMKKLTAKCLMMRRLRKQRHALGLNSKGEEPKKRGRKPKYA